MRAARSAALGALALAGALVVHGCGGSGSSGSRAGLSTAPITSQAVTPVGSSASATAPVVTAAPALPPAPPLLAGASRVDVTPSIGVPLAGYGGGGRRHKLPNLSPNAYDHFLVPSTSVRDPIQARALFLRSGTSKPVAIVAIDAIAMTDEFVRAVHRKAQALGSSVAYEDLMIAASHTHSGPACLTHLWIWQLTAADVFQSGVFNHVTTGVAKALVEAEKAAVPAQVGVTSGQIAGVTHNRRSGVSPVFNGQSVDPECLVVRVDDAASGNAIATVWNFAIHGISLSDDSLAFSADVMGGVNAELEARNQGVALFLNSAEGDISPDFWGDQGIKTGGRVIADRVATIRAGASTEPGVEVVSRSETVDWGAPFLDVTLNRLGPNGLNVLGSGGWLFALQNLGVNPGVAVPLPSGWIEREFRHQAIRIGKSGLVSMPGEPIHVIGLDLKARGKSLGFDHVLTVGLANGHAGYVTTEPEYKAGGYEAICTLFGSKTSEKLVLACEKSLAAVKP